MTFEENLINLSIKTPSLLRVDQKLPFRSLPAVLSSFDLFAIAALESAWSNPIQ